MSKITCKTSKYISKRKLLIVISKHLPKWAKFTILAIALTIVVNDAETTMYEYKSDLEFYTWIKTNFIPVSELVGKFNRSTSPYIYS